MNPGSHEMGSWHPLGRSTDDDLQLLAAGQETLWWDESGRPAPWPQDFLDPAAGWTTAVEATSDRPRCEDDPEHPPF